LIEIDTGVSLTRSLLRIDKRILCYLLGEPSFDSKLESIVKPISVADIGNIKLQPSHNFVAEQLATIWSEAVLRSNTPIVELCSIETTASNQIAAIVCHRNGCNLYVMKARVLTNNSDEIKLLLRRWEREALLSNSALLLDCHDISATDTVILFAIQQLVENIKTRLIIACRLRLPIQGQTFITLDVPKLTNTEQLAIWRDALGESKASSLNGLSALVSQFNISQFAIYTAVSTAIGLINTWQDQPADRTNLGTVLWDCCRKMARPQLDDLAQRIETNATWDDLILPEIQKQTLHSMVTHVQQRMKVYEQWGFASKSSRSLGITALLAGESGTGKTMSAEVIAKELRLDLYRIDLSAVVSKYIGETEKNLRRIFDAAETGGAVLLFDEADALFSKRTAVKDSHDRNANMETNYLLQRMEAYQGLAILTTNLKDSIDSAFMRRIRFVVKYRFPDVPEREQLWRRIYPEKTPTEGLDYTKLAKLNVAGGNIRNIALNAAFIAANTNEPVMMKHILEAATAEYLKLGRTLTDTEIKGWR
jgi:AAA+ superfamily predicted ATPase